MKQVLESVEKIAGEEAFTLEQLPEVWKTIASGSEEFKMEDREAYVKMAQLFLYKLSKGDLDLFNKRDDFQEHKEVFTKIFSKLAYETLEFYGEDFKIENYPNFDEVEASIHPEDPDKEDKIKVVQIARELFADFAYDLPASFYKVHLAPIARAQVCEIVPLRFSEDDKKNARAWDASLHGQKVFPMQLFIQSISSEKGFFWEHGCGCNHGLSRVGRTETSFKYRLRPEMRKTWVRDFLWTVWYEYAFFNFTPVTKFLTGEIVEFEK